MKPAAYVEVVLAFLVAGTVLAGDAGPHARTWHAGKWDSTIYNRSEKPRTVAVRIELTDAETGMPLEGAQVSLKGEYTEERIGTAGEEVGVPYEPQERQFEMTAVSGRDGIVVFALSWQKEYPWSLGAPDHVDVHTSWIKPVDDIEKVQRIEVRHPRYLMNKRAFDFSHLLKFGQDKNTQWQEPGVFEAFEDAWGKEIKRDGVKFCVLDLGKEFEDFGNRESARAEFFKKVRDEDFGTVYREPHNFFSVGEYPQSECGPYFVYLLELAIERRSGQADVRIEHDGRTDSGHPGEEVR
ncbi:MAG: hypothetical protein J7M19_09220 [Planctomycetes bacterium]|nr:hypothetical protein [Planctomycetota bacterium]